MIKQRQRMANNKPTDEVGRPYLFQCDPSGAYFAWKATAMGKNYVNGKTFLEKR